MAVSKTQNERPAILALIDLANQLEEDTATNARNIESLGEDLADEVGDREAADRLLEEAIGAEAEARADAVQGEAEARAEAVQGVQTQIGDGFTVTSVTTALSNTNQQILLLSDEQAAIAGSVLGILDELANIKFGITVEITVPANDSYAGSFAYSEPFDSSVKSLVMLGFADGPVPATLSIALVDSTYAGFSYSITNTDTDPATVTVGYLAIAAIPLS